MCLSLAAGDKRVLHPLKMTKRKKSREQELSCSSHHFSEDQLPRIREDLLSWYDRCRRDLPWRRQAAGEADLNLKGYAVWVSEVMLQQTQVATVKDYYVRWMSTWPDVRALAGASLDQVHQVWAGLGYYSRAERLWLGARRVRDDFKGQLPRSSSALIKDIPGVGRYTAAAIASIAFGEVVGVVDGNVARVVSRLRRIGADVGSQRVQQVLWSAANALVDPDRPGDFNQAIMELGATVCTAKNPSCAECPLAGQCLARSGLLAGQSDEPIETCHLCLPRQDYKSAAGVANYPRKLKKTLVKDKSSLVVVLSCNSKYCLIRRPSTGLLANLLEFPSVDVAETGEGGKLPTSGKEVAGLLKSSFQVATVTRVRRVGQVRHQFSHIRQVYHVWSAQTSLAEARPAAAAGCEVSWLSAEQLATAAISTAMKKVFAATERAAR